MSATMNLHDEARTDIAVTSPVQFVCPRCGEDRSGVLVRSDEGAWVDCDVCEHRSDEGVLEIPTEAMLVEWYAQAVRHARAALRCADGSPAGSYLAVVWCRRLAPEMSLTGKMSFLETVARPLVGTLTDEQRAVVLDLGIALRMPPAELNDVLASV